VNRERHDTADERLTRIQEILGDAATRIREVVEAQNQLVVSQAITEQKLQALTDLLLREPRNGHGK
jgi:hypothetical protein